MMRWPYFTLLVLLLGVGNFLVYAQEFPSVPSQGQAQSLASSQLPDVPTTVPPAVMQLIQQAPPPDQANLLPRRAQEELARQRQSSIDELLGAVNNANPVANGQLPLGGSATNSSGNNSSATNPSGTSPSTSTSSSPASTPTTGGGTSSSSLAQGDSALNIVTRYTTVQSALNRADYVQALDLATKADVALRTGYTDQIYDELQQTKRDYQQFRDVLGQFKDQLNAMKSRLPTVIANCVHP